MSSRRAARAAALAPPPESLDPRHISVHTLDHPVYGHVTYRMRAGEVTRIHWSATNLGQNFISAYWQPERLREVLDQLGI